MTSPYPCLWFDGNALEAAESYVSLFPDSRIDKVWRSPGPCGWIRDRFGLSWQIVPRRLRELTDDPDPDRARRAMEAMLSMGKIEISELEHAADGH